MKSLSKKDIVFIIAQLIASAFALYACVEAYETRKEIERAYEMRLKK